MQRGRHKEALVVFRGLRRSDSIGGRTVSFNQIVMRWSWIDEEWSRDEIRAIDIRSASPLEDEKVEAEAEALLGATNRLVNITEAGGIAVVIGIQDTIEDVIEDGMVTGNMGRKCCCLDCRYIRRCYRYPYRCSCYGNGNPSIHWEILVPPQSCNYFPTQYMPAVV